MILLASALAGGPIWQAAVEIARDCVHCHGRGTLRKRGVRWRQLVDTVVTRVLARRFECGLCHKWYTLLPAFVVPGYRYSARVIVECVGRRSVTLTDPDRWPEDSTVRRWGLRFGRACARAASRLFSAAAILVRGWKNVVVRRCVDERGPVGTAGGDLPGDLRT